MPHVVPMKTLSGPEFNAWFTKHSNSKGSSLDGAAYIALAKEDKVKARERMLEYASIRKRAPIMAKMMKFEKELAKQIHEGLSDSDVKKYFHLHIAPLLEELGHDPKVNSGLVKVVLDKIHKEQQVYRESRPKAELDEGSSKSQLQGLYGLHQVSDQLLRNYSFDVKSIYPGAWASVGNLVGKTVHVKTTHGEALFTVHSSGKVGTSIRGGTIKSQKEYLPISVSVALSSASSKLHQNPGSSVMVEPTAADKPHAEFMKDLSKKQIAAFGK